MIYSFATDILSSVVVVVVVVVVHYLSDTEDIMWVKKANPSIGN